MNKQYYIVGAIHAKHDVEIAGYEQSLLLKWTDGMIGVCAVFTNKHKAEKYADKKFTVFSVKAEKF